MMAAPREAHNPNSPAGQIESFGQIADGLTRLTGWRREFARWAIVALFCAPLITVVVAHIVR